MAKVASISARVDENVKEQAEVVLSQLGVSMATAMEMYLRQIALQRKIPFEMALPVSEPKNYAIMTDEEFDVMMSRSMEAYATGKCETLEAFEERFTKEMGV